MPLQPVLIRSSEAKAQEHSASVWSAERLASSASIASTWAKMGTQAAEPGRAKARDAWRSRLVRSNSAVASPLTSWARPASDIGGPRAVLLLGKHLVKPSAQVGLYGGVGGDALDGAHKLAASSIQLIRSESMQCML